ncbi:folylpolyglutamate synthase, mitochondrial-like [Linepithema humile]|uniref:folylpolyglutamate synthase, mitochondrial-like n=1 Tax=Linepithema humile TaxID=83485 RepID=UPI000623050D|nr:PREDICTED: folylpolyglutamate synthase, mitochondrial-like [Linepithema humile]XP_012224245.1 PREDICTED: folylpolyglutamate synthase, mitochondrial-like [Linepithema humile]
MFTLLKKMMQNELLGRSALIDVSYEEALKTLTLSLQSNAAYLQSVQNVNDPAKLKETEKYLLRSGITLEQLDSLSVIHVAGTKGKGSTCAFTEAILRQHGFSTGFFSSPHLVSVRERIRLNGEPISRSHFTRSFWNVYRNLERKREYESDMPTYFRFLTILTFHVFLEANVDVAIVEVGIGGELDSTNVLRNPVCVGVTSLALEHTALLGNTLEAIAHQKSGIFKPHARAFTVPQAESAMRVLRARAEERRCRDELRVVQPDDNRWNDVLTSAGVDVNGIQRQNALLSIDLAHEWMKSRCGAPSLIAENKYINGFHADINSNKDSAQVISSDKVAVALADCKWPGRTQILRTSVADFFLDGAHTVESIDNCVLWFNRASRKTSTKFLIFNTSGDRDSQVLLKRLKPLNFDKAYFTPNQSGVASVEDLNAMLCAVISKQMEKCEKQCEWWGEGSVLKKNVAEVLCDIKRCAPPQIDKVEILVTGSLHLIGVLLTILDPDLTMTSDF